MDQPSNAKLLFDKISIDYIRNYMLGQDFENTWLACKTKYQPKVGLIGEPDKKPFAKAMSGFGNTSGGVILYGIEARKNDADVDRIERIVPINELAKFEADLREYETRAVERAITGLQYKAIKTDINEGILAVYVPQSDYGPHRSTVDRHFYMRAGDSFKPMDLNMIEDLMFRRIRTDIDVKIIYIKEYNDLYVAVENKSRVIAKNPYFVIKFPQEVRPTGFELDGNHPLRSWHHLEEFQGERGYFSEYADSTSLVVHPGTVRRLMSLRDSRGVWL